VKGNAAPVTRALALLAVLVAGCAGGPPPPAWRLEAVSALAAFERHYLRGETQLAELEFARAKQEIRASGRPDLLARAELARCAARAASLEFDGCPGFQALRADAGAEELAYADYLAGKRTRARGEEPLSRLVHAGVALRTGTVTPVQIGQAIDIASAEGWRRPLAAWLEVAARRAEAAGDAEGAARLRRRIALTLANP